MVIGTLLLPSTLKLDHNEISRCFHRRKKTKNMRGKKKTRWVKRRRKEWSERNREDGRQRKKVKS